MLRRVDGAPGEIIGDRPVSSFNHPAGLPIDTLLVRVLRRPVESAQYTAIRLIEHLDLEGIAASIGTVGRVDWYNNRRLLSSLGMLTPVESETLYYEALTREPAPTKQRQRTRDDSEKPVGARELTTRKESTFDDSQE